ncbi:MAG: hypothetical protein ACK55Z_19500, partial [bacterium]
IEDTLYVAPIIRCGDLCLYVFEHQDGCFTNTVVWYIDGGKIKNEKKKYHHHLPSARIFLCLICR